MPTEEEWRDYLARRIEELRGDLAGSDGAAVRRVGEDLPGLVDLLAPWLALHSGSRDAAALYSACRDLVLHASARDLVTVPEAAAIVGRLYQAAGYPD